MWFVVHGRTRSVERRFRVHDSPNGSAEPPSGDHGVERGGDTRPVTGIGQVSDTAVRLTGTDGAAVALLSKSAAVRELVYATDPLAQQLDELQFTIGEGPCIDAYTSGLPQLVDDLDGPVPRSKWPIFVSDATALGAASVFAYPIASGPTAFGVLELYRLSTGRLGSAEQAAAQTCALAVGRTLLERYAADQDQRVAGGERPSRHDEFGGDARFTRADVYVAAGMAAVQLAVSADEALDRLRAYAYQSGRRVRDVADDIIARRLSLRDERDDGGGR